MKPSLARIEIHESVAEPTINNCNKFTGSDKKICEKKEATLIICTREVYLFLFSSHKLVKLTNSRGFLQGATSERLIRNELILT